MDARAVIKYGIEMESMISLGYLEDLNDAELLHRPCAGCNHINWQMGHLIASEHKMMNGALPGTMPELPAGFAEKYTPETAAIDDPAKFCTKAELMKVHHQQRAATMAALEKVSDADFGKATGIEYAPTIAAIFAIQGSHWLMHAGQWVVVRRQLGRKPMF